MMRTKKNLIWMAAAYLLFIALTAACFTCAVLIESKAQTLSLRFHDPLTKAQGEQARRFAARDDSDFWPTYWREDTVTCMGELASSTAKAITVSGESQLVLNSPLLSGSFPAGLQQNVCAISKTLSWSLCGNVDSVGLTIQIEEKDVTICGVFEEESPVVLMSADNNNLADKWQAVALFTKKPDTLSHENAENFAEMAGLGTADTCINGPVIAKLSLVAALLPIIILVLLFLISALLRALKNVSIWREPIVFTLFLLLALALPYILAKIPDAFIPTRWSDFAFWGRLVQQLYDSLMEYLLCYPLFVDGQVRALLLLQLVLESMSYIALTVMIMLSHFKNKECTLE